MLADPPYAFDGWAGLMGGLDADLLVAESDRPVEPAPGWEVVRAKRYGTTHVTFLQRGARTLTRATVHRSGDLTGRTRDRR